jgi:hypothetical protein
MNISIAPVKKTREYVNNKDFLKALIDYKESKDQAIKDGKPAPPVPNYIGECFMMIAENLSHLSKFINYPHREDMVGDGIENCLMYFSNFDPLKSENPFAYFTQIVYYAFLRRIQKEKKQLYIKYKSTEQFGILDEYEMSELGDGTNRQFEMYDNISEFIGSYEESQKKKKAEKKVTKKPKGIEVFLED